MPTFIVPLQRATRITAVLGVGALAVATAPSVAQARISLTGSSRGYRLTVPGNEVISGTVRLVITPAAARHNRLVPWSVSCKPGRTPTQKLITFAALGNGVRVIRGPAQSIGLVAGDHCTIRRRSVVVRHITLR